MYYLPHMWIFIQFGAKRGQLQILNFHPVIEKIYFYLIVINAPLICKLKV